MIAKRESMKSKNELNIKLLDFFKYGEFDCIKLGQTKEWILNNFPEPDSQEEVGMDIMCEIWKYGSIEFHFTENKILFLIFSDAWFNKFEEAKNIKIDKWIFKNIKKLNLINVIKIFNENEINYQKIEDKLKIKLKLESDIEITFENIKNANKLNKNKYIITSFGLFNPDL